ncbi:MAG: murein biosynthesis integral membrane protein MurJ [Gammaproteobacteria bacterium]|nr:MAG: murein biosynthesis integral membrane protein MurJ [Gammaproteobacteria bacterium]
MSRGLLRSSLIVSLFTFLSRIFGVVRDAIFAHYLGDSAATDAFYIAFKIPNLSRRIFAEGAFAQAFVPVLSEYQENKTKEETQLFLQNIYGTLGGILILISSVGVITAPVIAFIFAPGWFFDNPESYETTSELLRFTVPYMFFISMVACAGAVLNTHNRFAVPAFTPVLLNICLISATLFIAPYFDKPQHGVAFGVLIAGIVQLLFQLPFLIRVGALVKPVWGWGYSGVQKVIKLMIPSIIGSSATQINLLIGSILASTLVSGSVSWLYYSDRLMEFPVGLFGIALGTVILPKLSKQFASSSEKGFSETLDWAIKLTLTISIPSVVALIILAAPMIATIFGHGKVDLRGVQNSAASLIAYAFGVMGFIMVKIFSPAFYARKDTKTPMRFGLISVAINIFASIVLIFFLAHVGLALATSLAAISNAALLYSALIKRGIYQSACKWRLFFIQLFIANFILAIVLLFVPQIEEWMSWTLWFRVKMMCAVVLGSALIYFFVLIVVGLKPKELLGVASEQ